MQSWVSGCAHMCKSSSIGIENQFLGCACAWRNLVSLFACCNSCITATQFVLSRQLSLFSPAAASESWLSITYTMFCIYLRDGYGVNVEKHSPKEGDHTFIPTFQYLTGCMCICVLCWFRSKKQIPVLEPLKLCLQQKMNCKVLISALSSESFSAYRREKSTLGKMEMVRWAVWSLFFSESPFDPLVAKEIFCALYLLYT